MRAFTIAGLFAVLSVMAQASRFGTLMNDNEEVIGTFGEFRDPVCNQFYRETEITDRETHGRLPEEAKGIRLNYLPNGCRSTS
jgi:hypothetical protein